MLDPDYIDKAGDLVAGAYAQIEAEMLDYLVAQILMDEKLTSRGHAALAMLAQTHDAALREILRRNAGNVAAAVSESVEDALKRSDEDDVRRLGGGRTAYQRQVAATVDGIARILERDNLDMIEGAKRAFLEASTSAITSTNIAATTPDRAIHEAVRRLERDGISVISYRNAATGRQTVKNHVDVAVRRHVRTQIAQDGARMTLERMRELDVALVEVSSHPGARPEHAEWQGRCYSLKGDVTIDGVRYRDFYAATGYGTVDGLLGANCRHSFAPYIHGAKRAYAHDPKHASGVRNDEVYRLTQKQRRAERRIREAKRELSGAQQIYNEDKGTDALADLMLAKDALRGRQADMRRLIAEANAKAKPGTSVLHRNPRREWAGDMPMEQLAASAQSKRRAREVIELKSECARKRLPVYTERGDALGKVARAAYGKLGTDHGYNVVAHGTPKTAQLIGKDADHKTLASIILARKDYTPGTPVRLLSCSTGDDSGSAPCFAQRLADELGVDVTAPDGMLWIHSDGTLEIGDEMGDNTGSFKVFHPRRRA